MSSWKGLIAGAIHEKMDMSFDQAYMTLNDLPSAELDIMAADFPETTVIYSSKEISVLDKTLECGTKEGISRSKEECSNQKQILKRERSFCFNRKVDLKQSSMLLDGDTGKVLCNNPPLDGLEGLSLVAGLCDKQKEPGEPLSIVVLGGGGCSVPSFLYTHLSPMHPNLCVEVVEYSSEVCEIAREYFGVAELEASSGGSFRLIHGDARSYMEKVAPGKIDMLIVDIEDGGFTIHHDDEDRLIQAPPAWLLHDKFLKSLGAAVCPGGALAINTLACQRGFEYVSTQLDGVLKSHNFGYSVSVPAPEVERQRFYMTVKLKGKRQFSLDEETVQAVVRPETHAHWLDALRGHHWYKL